MPERRFTILATGPFPAAEERPELLTDQILLEIIPFIQTMPLTGTPVSERVEVLSRLPINAVFTSSEAVYALRALLPVPPPWSGFTTSGPTQLLLQEWLGREASVRSAPDAASLADVVVGAGVREAVFFCGNLRRDVLPERVNREGIALEELTVYETISTPVVLGKEYDAVLFFSPGAVDSFFTVNRIGPDTVVFAIGPTTAGALERHISHPVILPESPDKILLLQKAIGYAHAHPGI